MSIQFRRVTLLTLSLMLMAVPASAQAKTSSAKHWKKMAKSVNSIHSQWAGVKDSSVTQARAAGAQVAAQCLPVMEAAGKADTMATASLSIGYLAVENGGATPAALPMRRAMQQAIDNASGISYRHFEAWAQQTAVLSGFYMSPSELCAAAEDWQKTNFSDDSEPLSLTRNMTVLWATPQQAQYKVMEKTARKLRRAGATPAAVKSWISSYTAEIPGQYDEPVMKALNPGEVLTTSSLLKR